MPRSHTLRSAAVLALAILIPTTSLAQQDARELSAAVSRAYAAKDYATAIELNKKLVKLEPKNPTHAYNMACLLSLSGKTDDAQVWLTNAIKLGFADGELLRNDPDLKPIHDTPAYKAALEKLKDTDFDFKQAADASEPLIIAPENLDNTKPAPMIVALHPYGGTADWIVAKWMHLARENGAILVAPRAVRPVAGRNGFQWGSTEEADYLVGRAIEQAESSYKVDQKHIVLTGFSQGAYMALQLGVKHADRVAGVISLAGRYDTGLAEQLKDHKPRFFLMVGDKDRMLESNKTGARELRAAGAKVELQIYKDLGHAFPTNYEQELRKAMKFVTGS